MLAYAAHDRRQCIGLCSCTSVGDRDAIYVCLYLFSLISLYLLYVSHSSSTPYVNTNARRYCIFWLIRYPCSQASRCTGKTLSLELKSSPITINLSSSFPMRKKTKNHSQKPKPYLAFMTLFVRSLLATLRASAWPYHLAVSWRYGNEPMQQQVIRQLMVEPSKLFIKL